MTNDDSDFYRSKYGAYDYRTADAQQREERQREADRQSWESVSRSAGGSGGFSYSGGGGGGDGWTAIAALLLFGAGLTALYYAALLVAFVYVNGVSPYVYFYNVLTSRFGITVLLWALLFLAAQAAPFLVFVRTRRIWWILLYVAVLPPLNVALVVAAESLFDVLAPILDLRPTLAGLGAGLPRNVEMPLDVSPAAVAFALPAGIVTLGLLIPTLLVVREVIRYLTLTILACTRWLLRSSETARQTWAGRAVLVLSAVLLLVLSGCCQSNATRSPIPPGHRQFQAAS